jgi:hypothetical protein
VSHRLTMVLDPCLKFTVERARDGRVSLFVDPVAADDPAYRIDIKEGETWVYALKLDGDGFGQGNRIEREPTLDAPAQRAIGGHFRRRR